jgi:hypothetical protein
MHKGAKVMEGAPGHLVRTRIERYVMEARYGNAFPRAADVLLDLPVRMDAATDSLRFYSQQDGALHELAARLGPGEYTFRETNLEDLFLQATGSALGEQQ